MTATITQLYGRLHSAVAADDFATAEEVLDEIGAAYDRNTPDERRTMGRALAARNENVIDSDGRKQVTDVATQYGRIEQSRMMALMAATVHVTNPTADGKDQLLDTLSEMESREETFEELLDDAESIVSGITVPPKVEIVEIDGPEIDVPKGETVEIEVEVENVGDESAADVEVRQENPLSLTPSATDEGDLAAGSVTRVMFSGTVTSTGAHVVEVTADASNARPAVDEIDLQVVAKSTAAEQGRDILTELRTIIEENDGIAGGLETSLLNVLSNAERHVDRALKHLESGDSDAADRRLNTAIKQLGAFLNRLEAATDGDGSNRKGNGGDDISATLVQTLKRVSESAIDELALAKRADL